MEDPVGGDPLVNRPGPVEGVDGVALRLVHIRPHRNLRLRLDQLVVGHVVEGDHLWDDVTQENLKIWDWLGIGETGVTVL